MSGYMVTDEEGRVVLPGDKVTDFRGDTASFVRVAEGPSLGKSGKVEALREGQRIFRYPQVFGLTVTAGEG